MKDLTSSDAGSGASEESQAVEAPSGGERSSERSEAAAQTRNHNKERREASATRHQTLRSALRAHLRSDSGEKEGKAAGEVAQEKPKTAQEAAVKPEAKTDDVIAPPADMTAEERQAFEAATPEIKKYLSRRHYEQRTWLTRKAEEMAEKERNVSGILRVANENREQFARLQKSPEAVFESALAWDRAMAKDPRNTAIEWLESHGLSPADLLEDGIASAKAAETPKYLTKEEAEALAEQKAQELLQRRDQEVTTRTSLSAVDKFISSKPVFKDPGTAAQVEDAMAPIVARLRAIEPQRSISEVLEDAYEYVLKQPQFSSLAAKLNGKAAAERTSAEAEKAKAASRSISGGPGSGSPTRKVQGFRANLAARLAGSM